MNKYKVTSRSGRSLTVWATSEKRAKQRAAYLGLYCRHWVELNAVKLAENGATE